MNETLNNDIVVIRCANRGRDIQKGLNECREERRPYVFITETMEVPQEVKRILVPISMLEEEVYKAEICTYIARKTGAHIILLKAKDYGSHAEQNTNRIATHIRSVAERTGTAISYEITEAKKDSFGLVREASDRVREFQADLLVLTASRDYGWDDILFGPPERHAIGRCSVPVMLVNPREDLFSLCD